MMNIEHVNVATGELLTVSFISLSWIDEYLVWNPNDYSGIVKLSLPFDMLWVPPLAQQYGESRENTGQVINAGFAPVVVYPNGTVHLGTTGYYKTKCDIDTSLYPFDSHQCSFWFTSARYDKDEMVLYAPLSGIAFDLFQENNAWIIQNTNSETLVYASGPSGHIVNGLRFGFALTRRPAFELINTYAPILLLTTLNAVTSFVPPDSGERLSFAITLYLAFIFLTTSLIDEMPRNAIQITTTSYVMLSLNALNTAGVMWSVFIVRLSKWPSTVRKIPNVLKAIVRWVRHKSHALRKTKVDGIIIKDSRDEDNVDHDVSNIADRNENVHWDESGHPPEEITWLHVAGVLDIIYFILTSILVTTVMLVMICTWKF